MTFIVYCVCGGRGGGQNTVGVKTPVFLNNYNYIENTTIFTNKFVERKLDSQNRISILITMSRLSVSKTKANKQFFFKDGLISKFQKKKNIYV